MHCAITPRNPTELANMDMMVLQCCEDARIWLALTEVSERIADRIAVDACPRSWTDALDNAEKFAKGGVPLRKLACTLVATYNYGTGRTLWKWARDNGKLAAVKIAQQTLRYFDDRPLTFDQTTTAAIYLHETLLAAEDLEDKKLPPGVHSGTGHGPVPRISRSPAARRTAPAWGTMNHARPRLTERTGLTEHQALKMRPSDVGCAPTYIGRYFVDGRIFAQVLPQPSPPTVLLDASGSMDIDAADIDAILKECPGAYVAMYSGDAAVGQLTVIAQDGRRMNQDDIEATISRVGCQNTVDAPALKWLADQQEPRLWISDGGVHGTGEHSSTPQHHQECAKIMRKHDILRVKKADLETVRKGLAQSRRLFQ